MIFLSIYLFLSAAALVYIGYLFVTENGFGGAEDVAFMGAIAGYALSLLVSAFNTPDNALLIVLVVIAGLLPFVVAIPAALEQITRG